MIRFVLPILFPAILLGCLETPYPLSDPMESAVDSALFGKWLPLDAAMTGDSLDWLLILPFDKHAYYIEFADNGRIEGRMRAFETVVMDARMANIEVLGSGRYFYYGFKQAGDTLSLLELDDVYADFEPVNEQELRQLVADAVGGDSLFSGLVSLFVRVERYPPED